MGVATELDERPACPRFVSWRHFVIFWAAICSILVQLAPVRTLVANEPGVHANKPEEEADDTTAAEKSSIESPGRAAYLALSSKRYIERRAAFLLLWKAGQSNLSAIKQAREVADQQLAQTLKLLEALIELEVEPGDEDAMKAVSQYLAKPNVEVIRELCRQGNWKLAARLLHDNESLRQKLAVQSRRSDMRSLLRVAFMSQDLQQAWPVVELLLPSEQTFALARRSGLDLSERFLESVPDTQRLFFEGDYNGLAALDAPWREKLPWIARAGHWSSLADPALHAQIAPTIASPQIAELVRCVLLDFAGEYDASKEVWEQLKRSIQRASGDGQAELDVGVELLREAGPAKPIAMFALMCLGKTEALAAYLESEEADESLAVLASMGHYDRALLSVGLEEGLTNFDNWLESTLRDLAKELQPGVDTRFRKALRICGLLSRIGEHEKSKKLLETLTGVVSVKIQAYGGGSQRNRLEAFLWQRICQRLAFGERSRVMLYDLVRRDYRRLRPAVRHTALEYLLPNISQCAVLLLETVDPTTRPNSIPSDEAWEKLERLYRLETKSTAEVEAWLRRAFKRSVEMGAEATLQLAQIARGFGLADLALEFCNSPGSGFGEQQGEAGEILAARGRLGSAVGSYARLRMGGIFYRVDDEVEVLLRSGLFDQAKSLQQRRFLLPLVGVQQAMTGELDASSAFSSVSRKLFEQNKVEASAEYGSLAYLLSSPYRRQSYIAADGLARSLEELERFRESADVRRASMVELLYGSSEINQIFSSPEMVMSYFPSLKQTVVQERLERAAVLIASGEVDSAIHEIEIAMAADPQHIEIAIQTVPLLAAEHPEAADRIFDVLDREMQSVLTRWPKNAFTLNNLAWMYAKCGRKLDEAHDLATRATLVAPKSATYLDTLAEVQFMQGDVEAAIKSARMCVQIDPREAHYRENIVRFRAARSKH